MHVWRPPVCRVGPDAADVEQEDDALEVTLGGGEVQRGAAVVVRGGHVHALQVQPLQRRRVARHRREQQRNHRQPLLLETMLLLVGVSVYCLQPSSFCVRNHTNKSKCLLVS